MSVFDNPSPYPEGVVLPPPEKPGWFRRNWFWAVPLGCLLPILLCAGLIGGGMFAAFRMIRQSEPFTTGLEAARVNPEVQQALGEPIEAGTLITGQINFSGSSGSADLAIPLKGPKGQATLAVNATRTDGVWKYTVLRVTIPGREPIDLQPPPGGGTPSPQPDTEARPSPDATGPQQEF